MKGWLDKIMLACCCYSHRRHRMRFNNLKVYQAFINKEKENDMCIKDAME